MIRRELQRNEEGWGSSLPCVWILGLAENPTAHTQSCWLNINYSVSTHNAQTRTLEGRRERSQEKEKESEEEVFECLFVEIERNEDTRKIWSLMLTDADTLMLITITTTAIAPTATYC